MRTGKYRPPWKTPWRDVTRRLTRRGRHTLAVKRALLGMLRDSRQRYADAVWAEIARKEGESILSRFEEWDAEESRRIFEAFLTDLEFHFPGKNRAELRGLVLQAGLRARDLPVGRERA